MYSVHVHNILFLLFLLQLVLSGVINQDLGISFMSDILSHVTRSDYKSKTYSLITVVTSFARQSADDFAGIIPRKYKVLLKYKLPPPQTKVTGRLMLNRN